MARPSKHDGAVFKRNDGKILWITYRDRDGKRVRESTFTEDWQEAQRKLRERLQARDDKLLEIVRKGEQLQFSTWVDFFLENYSQPPLRAEKTRGQFARRSAFKESLWGSQARGSLGGRHRVVSAPAAPGSSPDKNRRRCCPARETETSHGSSGASDLTPGSECGRAKEVAAFESVCRGRVPSRGEGSFPAALHGLGRA